MVKFVILSRMLYDKLIVFLANAQCEIIQFSLEIYFCVAEIDVWHIGDRS